VGTITASLSGGIALGSWWSLVPLAPFVLLFLRRTMVEDRVLRRELEGLRGLCRAGAVSAGAGDLVIVFTGQGPPCPEGARRL